MDRIGEVALRLVLEKDKEVDKLKEDLGKKGYTLVVGKVGSMNMEKVIAAIETASKREGLISEDDYKNLHALYHAVMEALHGICRGQMLLGDALRTVGLTFSVVKGPKLYSDPKDSTWIAVVLYGTIGAPRKGFEHESIGLGINHL